MLFAVSGFCVSVTKENLVNNKDIKISGDVAIEEGQFVQGHHYTKRSDTVLVAGDYHYESFPYPVWNHRAYARIQIEAQLTPRLRVLVSPEFKLWYESYPSEDVPAPPAPYPFRQHAKVSIAEGECIYSFGDVNKPVLQIAGGVFSYKYNPEASNLGEYLFRTGCYPPYIETSFDYPYPILSGIKISSKLLNNNLSQDILLTTETQISPLYDWSLSYLVGYKIPSLLEIGGGVMLNRLIPASNSQTQPNLATNMYLSSTGQVHYYSFAGTKLMGRISFDPKGLLPASTKACLGKEDGKIYSEIALLGVKNYPQTVYNYRDIGDNDSTIVVDPTRNYYSDRTKRMPVMIGFNVPTFKVLDLLSIQAEWFDWPFIDAYNYFTQSGLNATPLINYSTDYPLSAYKADSWKWSIYAKKNVNDNFAIIGQASRDHTHHDGYYEIIKDDNEVFTKNNEWGWWLKLEFKF
jgi:hypothetical protein